MAQYLNLDEAASSLARALAENCKARRKELKMTQVELCARSGLAASHLSYIENARANPSLEVLEAIAYALDTTVLALLTAQN